MTAWEWTQPDLGVDIRAEHDRIARAALEAAVAIARAPYPKVTVTAQAEPGAAADVLTRRRACGGRPAPSWCSRHPGRRSSR